MLNRNLEVNSVILQESIQKNIQSIDSHFFNDEKRYITELTHSELIFRDLVIRIQDSEKKTLILHDNDMDGYTAASILQHHCIDLTEEEICVELYHIGHGKPFEELDVSSKLKDFDTLVIIDLEVSDLILEKYRSQITTYVIDHHPLTTKLYIEKKENVIAFDFASATGLVTYFSTTENLLASAKYNADIKEKLIILGEIVNYYDTWCFGLYPEYDEAAKAFGALWFNDKDYYKEHIQLFFKSRNIHAFIIEEMISKGKGILSIQDKQIKKIIKSNVLELDKKFMVDGEEREYHIGYVQHSDLIDDLASSILKEKPGLDFVVISYLKNGTNPYKLCFRSLKDNDEIDVGKIARALGGGGHRSAAGVNLKLIDFIQFLA